MIFVTVGTQKFQFDRLLKEIDSLIASKYIKEKVFIQRGNSTYLPQNAECFEFVDNTVFERLVNECDLLITHSGVATIIKGLKLKKKVLVVPRLKKYGEHVDDHQLQIANAFSERNFVEVCVETSKLLETIDKIGRSQYEEYKSCKDNVISVINEYLNDLK